MDPRLEELIQRIYSLESQMYSLTAVVSRLTEVFEQYVEMGVNLEKANTEKQEQLGEIISNVSGKKKSSMWEHTNPS